MTELEVRYEDQIDDEYVAIDVAGHQVIVSEKEDSAHIYVADHAIIDITGEQKGDDVTIQIEGDEFTPGLEVEHLGSKIVEADLERERSESYELGHISQLEKLVDDLRVRAGEKWALADSHAEISRAKQLKGLAEKFEREAEERREEWEEEYQNG